MAWGYGGFPKYVPVAERRANARRQIEALREKGQVIEPVEIEGRTIARSFWGKGWCDHLESFSDFSNRLPRGRTYVRNGSVCHMAIKPGRLEAMVSGSELYTVDLRITKLKPDVWEAIKARCAGQVGSMLELLQGRLSEQVMRVVTDRKAGLFPQPGHIKLDCTCPDWATMCKHVAAVLYAVGSRLDEQPDLLFHLRGVDPQELIGTELALPDATDGAASTLADDQLSDIFGIDLEGNAEAPAPVPAEKPKRPARTRHRKQAPSDPTTSRPTPGRTRGNRRGKAMVRPALDSPGRLPNIRPTGKSVARLRRQLKLSAAAFADEMGVSAASVYRWESITGRLQLQPRSLHALARMRQKTDGGQHA